VLGHNGYFTTATAPDSTSRIVLGNWISRLAGNAPPGQAANPWYTHLAYGQIIEQNFARLHASDARTLIDRLSDQELHDLVGFYLKSNADSGHKPHLLQVWRARLDNARLARVNVEYQAAVLAVADGTSKYGGINWAWYQMSPYEIYLDLRTAPVGAASVGEALLETSWFCAREIYWSYKAGENIGTALVPVIEKYDPQLMDDIGGTIDEVLQEIYDAGNGFINVGKYQQLLGQDYTWSPYGTTVALDGIGETTGGDYDAGAAYNMDYQTDFGGTGNTRDLTCWPFECSMR
jgi:hypothetical protein